MSDSNDPYLKVRSFTDLIRRTVSDNPELADKARRYAGMSKQHWQGVLDGTSPDSARTAKICIALGIQEEYFALYQEEPEEVKRQLSKILADLGVQSQSRSDNILEAMLGHLDPAEAVDARELFLECLSPFSDPSVLGSQLSVEDLRGLREASIHNFLQLIEKAGVSTRKALDGSQFGPALAAIYRTALYGQNTDSFDVIAWGDETIATPAIPLRTKTLANVHIELLRSLAPNQDNGGRLILFGVTTLMPSYWYNAPTNDDQRPYIGEENNVLSEYREAISELIKKNSEVSVLRLTLATDDAQLNRYGLVTTKEAKLQTSLLEFVPDDPGQSRRLTRSVKIREGIEKLDKIDWAGINPWHRVPKPSHLIVTESDRRCLEINGSLGSGWSCKRLIDRYIEDLHSDNGAARHTELKLDDEAFLDNYFEKMDPPYFEYIFVGEEIDEEIHWKFCMSGDADWITNSALLQLITDEKLVQELGSFWFDRYKSEQSRSWLAMAEEGTT